MGWECSQGCERKVLWSGAGGIGVRMKGLRRDLVVHNWGLWLGIRENDGPSTMAPAPHSTAPWLLTRAGRGHGPGTGWRHCRRGRSPETGCPRSPGPHQSAPPVMPVPAAPPPGAGPRQVLALECWGVGKVLSLGAQPLDPFPILWSGSLTSWPAHLGGTDLALRSALSSWRHPPACQTPLPERQSRPNQRSRELPFLRGTMQLWARIGKPRESWMEGRSWDFLALIDRAARIRKWVLVSPEEPAMFHDFTLVALFRIHIIF